MDDIYKQKVKRYMKDLDKRSDESVHNYLKNMRADKSRIQSQYYNSAPVDDFATMGSDTQGVVRDMSKLPPEALADMKYKVNEVQAMEDAADLTLKERGYKPYLTKRTKKNPVSKIAYKNEILGKTLRILGPIAAIAGATLSPSADAAVMDAVVPGGVEEMGVADERSIPDPRYQEYIRRMSKRNK